jgi:hypothetical protein
LSEARDEESAGGGDTTPHHTRHLALATLSVLLAAAPTLAGFAGTDVFLPMVGRQAGMFRSDWYTTVWIYNPGGQAVTAKVYLLVRGTANPSPPEVDVSVGPGETEKVDNVVESLFHQQVFGALRVTCDGQKLVVTSRVYSKAAGQGEKTSVGQDFAGVPASFAIGAGETARVLGGYQTVPTADSDYRFNFGFVETTGHSASVAVTAYDEEGADLGSTPSLQVREFSQRQPAFKDYFPNVSTENVRLEVAVTSGSGRSIAYGSGTANGSQDPTTFEMACRDSVLSLSTVQHDATLVGDGTAGSRLGVADGAVTAVKLRAAGSAKEQVLTSNGSAVSWQPAPVLPYSGTVSSDGEPAIMISNTGTNAAILATSGASFLPAILAQGHQGVWGEGTGAGFGVGGHKGALYGRLALMGAGAGSPDAGVEGDNGDSDVNGYAGYFKGRVGITRSLTMGGQLMLR